MLVDTKILSRLQRRIGGVRKGSASYVYSLGLLGARIASPQKRLRPYTVDPSEYFMEHTLAEAEFYTQVHEANRAGKIELLEIRTEPWCWRTLLSLGIRLRTDMFMRLATRDEELSFFIEIDRGSTHLPSILRKLRQYEAYFHTGVEQQQHGVFPKVKWFVSDEARKRAIENVIRTLPTYSFGLFEVVISKSAIASLCTKV